MSGADRRILRLAVPALGSLAVEPLYVLVDTAIVGRLGTIPLAGLALAAVVLSTSFWIFNFLAYGTTARVAFLSGAGDHRGAARVAVQAAWLAVGIGTVLLVGLTVSGRALAAAMGGRGEVLDAAATYLRISALGIPFVLATLVGHGYLRGLEDTRTPLVVAAVSNALNVVIELWMVFGMDWGVAGSAWSTVIAQGFGAAWFAVLIARHVQRRQAGLRPDRAELSRLASGGLQLGIRTGALLATIAMATAVAARVDAVTLAAQQIVFQVWTFLALSVDALAIAAQALTGRHLGAGEPAEARVLAVRTMRLGAIAGAALTAGVVASSRVLPALFSGDPGVVSNARAALVVAGLLQIPAALVFVLDGVLMGAEDFAYLKWGTLAAIAGFVPFGLAVLQRPGLGIVWIWAGMGGWIAVRLAFNGARFAGRAWSDGQDRGGREAKSQA